jgi:tellurite resistance protein
MPYRVPPSLFGMVLGLVGLGTGWRIAASIWGVPVAVGELLMLIAAVVWAVVVSLFCASALRDMQAVAQDVEDPVLGATAMAAVPMRMVQRGWDAPAAILALPLFVLANAFVAALVVGSLRLALQGRLLPRATNTVRTQGK